MIGTPSPLVICQEVSPLELVFSRQSSLASIMTKKQASLKVNYQEVSEEWIEKVYCCSDFIRYCV